MITAGGTTVVLVAGVSSSGKSAVARRLTALGPDAISADADELLAGWYDTVSGRRASRPDFPDTAWLACHEWRWDPDPTKFLTVVGASWGKSPSRMLPRSVCSIAEMVSLMASASYHRLR
jgi:hypothetical protein